MTTFVFKANIEFEADDLDEAFGLLAHHFASLRDGNDTEVWFLGEFDLQPKD